MRKFPGTAHVAWLSHARGWAPEEWREGGAVYLYVPPLRHLNKLRWPQPQWLFVTANQEVNEQGALSSETITTLMQRILRIGLTEFEVVQAPKDLSTEHWFGISERRDKIVSLTDFCRYYLALYQDWDLST